MQIAQITQSFDHRFTPMFTEIEVICNLLCSFVLMSNHPVFMSSSLRMVLYLAVNVLFGSLVAKYRGLYLAANVVFCRLWPNIIAN